MKLSVTRSSLTVLVGVLLGFFCNTFVFVLQDYMDINALKTSSFQNFQFDRLFEDSTTKQSSLNIKLLCWIMTGPDNHYSKAIHVKNTWGSHCDKLIFMSTQEDSHLGAIKLLGAEEGRQGLWGKTKRAFKYVYENHFDDYEWFMKADDDTFVVVENLKEVLSNHSTNDPIAFGHNYKYLEGYLAGGAGYVLSRESLRRFVEQGINNASMCHQKDDGDEDVNLGGCLRNLHITRGDSRDEKGLKRFFPFEVRDHIIPKSGRKDWAYELYTQFDEKNGTACCSDTAVSFHYIDPKMMYVMYYLVYHLRPLSVNSVPDREFLVANESFPFDY